MSPVSTLRVSNNRFNLTRPLSRFLLEVLEARIGPTARFSEVSWGCARGRARRLSECYADALCALFMIGMGYLYVIL